MMHCLGRAMRMSVAELILLPYSPMAVLSTTVQPSSNTAELLQVLAFTVISLRKLLSAAQLCVRPCSQILGQPAV